MPKKNKLLRKREERGYKEKPVNKFKSESGREREERLKKKKPARKMSNKDIAFMWIIHHVDTGIHPSPEKFNEIAGMTLRGARPDKVDAMIRDKLKKMLKPLVKLMAKRGYVEAEE